MIDSNLLNFVDDKDFEKRLQKHDKWRQKQIDIFYRTGKPIFTMTLETQHLRSNNNPHHFIEKTDGTPNDYSSVGGDIMVF